MGKTIKFFLKDKYKTTYAIQAEFEKDRDLVVIKVFDFDREEVYIGYYDSDGSWTKGDELDMPEGDVKLKILETVFKNLGGK